jgi:hypothetical protein
MPNRRKPQPSALVQPTIYLTPVQPARLKDAAAEHLRSVGSYVTALDADEPE